MFQVIQRREDGSVDFYLKWLDYKYGFGSVEKEHWLGNEKIHRLTSQKTYKLRVDLADFEGESRYAEYDQFLVADEDLDYQLILGEYQGTAGVYMIYLLLVSRLDCRVSQGAGGSCSAPPPLKCSELNCFVWL